MKSKVLVIDDSALARRLVRKILEELGHEVDEASDGEQALERYALDRHDFVVLDMVMHGLYGPDVLVRLKEMNPSLPVIVVSADIQKSTRDQVKEAGACAMLNKPLNKQQLIETLALVQTGGTAWI
jgi:CheY-like chemotaxis protein